MGDQPGTRGMLPQTKLNQAKQQQDKQTCPSSWQDFDLAITQDALTGASLLIPGQVLHLLLGDNAESSAVVVLVVLLACGFISMSILATSTIPIFIIIWNTLGNSFVFFSPCLFIHFFFFSTGEPL